MSQTRTNANVQAEEVVQSVRRDHLEGVALAEPDGDRSCSLGPARDGGFQRTVGWYGFAQLATLPDVNMGLIRHIPAVAREKGIEALVPVDGFCVWREEDDVGVARKIRGTGAVKGIPDEVTNDTSAEIRVGWACATNSAKHLDQPGRADDDAFELGE